MEVRLCDGFRVAGDERPLGFLHVERKNGLEVLEGDLSEGNSGSGGPAGRVCASYRRPAGPASAARTAAAAFSWKLSPRTGD